MATTTREMLYEKFKSYYNEGTSYTQMEKEMGDLLETIEKEAEDRMKEKCLGCIPSDGGEYHQVYSREIRASISSLK